MYHHFSTPCGIPLLASSPRVFGLVVVFPWSSNSVLWLKLMVVVSSSARSSGCASHALAVAVNPASAM
ncbi:hypothetical protein [Escherichia coli]|uniref:hypothetical protein n=1 Tax=Escherichia coli TaxID=562 RepID=UPI003D7F726F